MKHDQDALDEANRSLFGPPRCQHCIDDGYNTTHGTLRAVAHSFLTGFYVRCTFCDRMTHFTRRAGAPRCTRTIDLS